MLRYKEGVKKLLEQDISSLGVWYEGELIRLDALHAANEKTVEEQYEAALK